MKFNKWSVGLAAVGAVSLASVARAEEHAVVTALANTTISGYVDTSVSYNVGGDTANFPPYAFGGAGKADGFNLNVVQLNIEKPQSEGEWAAGYKVSLIFGPDATAFNASANSAGTADFSIKQAYVSLRVPVAGNGIDFKIGTFDTIIGYEVFESGSNPNFTRSYGYTVEPTEHTGILGSYKINENIAISAGVANTLSAGINARRGGGATGVHENHKTYMGAIALSAPKSWGFLEGSTLYAGIVDGFAGNVNDDQVNFYAGTVVKTPIAGLTAGFAFDYVDKLVVVGGETMKIYALYASYQIPDSKLSFHARGEYVDAGYFTAIGESVQGTALTGTIQYDLWKNVISRLEVRWDNTQGDVDGFGGPNPGVGGNGPARTDSAVTILANFVYKF